MLLASVWGPFLLAVAVTVVGGIVLALIHGGWRKLPAWREIRKSHERTLAETRTALAQVLAELQTCREMLGESATSAVTILLVAARAVTVFK